MSEAGAADRGELLLLSVGLGTGEALDAGHWLAGEGVGLAVAGQDPAADILRRPVALALIAGEGWFGVLEALRRASPETALCVVLAQGAVADAVKAMKAGASDCLQRPLNKERLLSTVRRRLDARRLAREVEGLRLELAKKDALGSIIGESPALKRCLDLARFVADLPVSVLITGESGTGKEALAKVLHQCSHRRQGPFVALDCGAIPAELADDELFGHQKGAFSSAEGERAGRLEQADGGTLFLDEVGNLPEAVQVKLLRALQTRETWRLGGQAGRPVDVRVVAATNADLPALVQRGGFRLDLFHRLNEFSLRLPPLRERGQDIERLARHFLDASALRYGRPALDLEEEALRRLLEHPWPGNIRQLENAMRRAVVMAEGKVGLADLPEEIRDWRSDPSPPSQVEGPWLAELPQGLLPLWEAEKRVSEEVERKLIWEALLHCRWDRAEAAKRLDLHVKTLGKKVRAYGLLGMGEGTEEGAERA